MAYDLQARFQKLRTVTTASTPTSPSDLSFIRNNKDPSPIAKAHAEGSAPDNIAQVELSDSYPLSISPADTDVKRLALAGDDNHAATPPIDVPATFIPGDVQGLPGDSLLHESRYRERSPLEDFLRNRRPSISFNPQVLLESGQRRGLEEPLPKLEIDTELRRRSIFQDLSRYSTHSPLTKSYSEAEKTNYDPFTGERIRTQSQRNYPHSKTRPPENRSRYPLLHPTISSLGNDRTHDLDQGASLTSASTASLIRSEIQTPPDETVDCLISPMSSFSPFHCPTSLEESSTWPILQRQESVPRAKSYSFDRKGSMRFSQRRSSRRSTACSSTSPATAFLSRFAREELSAEPDDEGQEVYEYVLGRQIGFGGFSTVKEAYTIEGQERVCRAVKIVRKHVANKGDLENERFQADFEHEVALWRCLAHRHILPLIAVYVTDFATFCFTRLIGGGTLFDLVRANRRGLERNLARRYAYQLASAIRYLHEDMRIVHRDIKLENCLIDLSTSDVLTGGGSLLLCDFGLAEFVTDESNRNSPDSYGIQPPRNMDPPPTSTSFAGSLQYASPELLSSSASVIHRSVDIWAFGVVVYALLVGDLPFRHAFQPRVHMMIMAGDWSVEALLHADGVKGREDEVLELMHGCLEMQSELRWVISQVLGSRWLNGCQEMLEEISESWKT